MSSKTAEDFPVIVFDIEEYAKPIIDEILKRNPHLEIHHVDYETVAVPEKLSAVPIVLARPPKIVEIVKKLGNLKWVQSAWVGVDGIDEIKGQYNGNPPFIYTRSEVGQGQLMSEFIIGQIIAWERRFAHFAHLQKLKIWERDTRYRSLDSLTIGLLGVGQIGKKVAEIAKCFGMEVYGLARSECSIGKCPHVDHYCRTEELSTLLRNSDFICNSLPRTAETREFLNSDLLSHCRERGSVFINVGRGDVITDEELLTALRKEYIKGAILDVLNEEPLAPSSPLWSLPNVIITPHISAETFPHKVAESFLRNYELFKGGEPLECVVDWEAGY